MENIVLFGASTLGVNYHKSIKCKHANFFFSDNDENKWGKVIEGVEVISPKNILNLKNPKVIITSMYYKDIQKQLGKMGIHNIHKAIKTPMDKVIDVLNQKNVKITECSALEVFGGNASFHTLDYACLTKDIEVWEIDKSLEIEILNNVPFAKVNIVDSYKEISKVKKKYDLVVVDNPIGIYGTYCEHFDLFPDIVNIFNDKTVLILNVIPNIRKEDIYKYPYLTNERYLQRRCNFYKVSNPMYISLNHMRNIYSIKLKSMNFDVASSFYIKRTFIYYLVFEIRKIS